MAYTDRCTVTLKIKGASFQGARAECEAWVGRSYGKPVWVLQPDGSLAFAGIVMDSEITTIRPDGSSIGSSGHAE